MKSFKSLLPKLPRAKRGPRFTQAIIALYHEMSQHSNEKDALSKIIVKDCKDAIRVLEAIRETK